MFRSVFVWSFVLIFTGGATFGQFVKDPQQPTPLDPEYRKFDALVSFVRARNAEQYAIRSSHGIDEASFVSIGGIEQWITIHGQDRANPVLLFLHGGPGDVTSCWALTLFAPWEEHFTVVQWDERGAGRTLKKSGPGIASTLTVDRMAQDGIELAEYLRKHLGKQKIVLVAHSFGSIIGLKMVQTRPDLFYAYAGTGQVADETKNYAAAYDALLNKARVLGNERAIEELSKVGPPPYSSGEGFRVQRKWANAFEGADRFLSSTLGLTLVAPGCSVEDINDSAAGQVFSAERLVPQTKSSGPKELGLKFSIPMFFFQGAEDFTTPTALARDYLKAIQAPQKAFVLIHGAGHFAVFMHPDQFLDELVSRVRPLAIEPRSSTQSLQ
ncbi:MAG TPA: alpha/beta hydrolase [Candidatus Angelobacter sp.]|nr:alpha/beta hydrolase [Candidatus Angelobacter sp.]